jgi:HEAT repeat protein
VPPLMKALSSNDEDEQVSAATALGVTSDRTALPPLKVLSGRSDSPAVREAATRSAILLYCC